MPALNGLASRYAIMIAEAGVRPRRLLSWSHMFLLRSMAARLLCAARSSSTYSAAAHHTRRNPRLPPRMTSLPSAKRLPAVVRCHPGLFMQSNTTMQQPFADQDAEHTVVWFEPAAHGAMTHPPHQMRSNAKASTCVYQCPRLSAQRARTATTTRCLPHRACPAHIMTGHDPSCLNRTALHGQSCVQRGRVRRPLFIDEAPKQYQA